MSLGIPLNDPKLYSMKCDSISGTENKEKEEETDRRTDRRTDIHKYGASNRRTDKSTVQTGRNELCA